MGFPAPDKVPPKPAANHVIHVGIDIDPEFFESEARLLKLEELGDGVGVHAFRR